MQTVVELPLKAPFELRVIEIPWVQVKIVGVDRDWRVLELDDYFYPVSLISCSEVEKGMFIKTELGQNAVETCGIRHEDILKQPRQIL